MIEVRPRTVNTWEEAAKILAANGDQYAGNINDLEEAVKILAKRQQRQNRRVAWALIGITGLVTSLLVDKQSLEKRLNECERQLREKQDRVHYNRV